MINNQIIDTQELTGAYTQNITLPPSSKLLDVIRREVNGICAYTLIYQYDANCHKTYSTFELYFTYMGYQNFTDQGYNYLTSLPQDYDPGNYNMVLWRRILTDIEKRELKIDHLLT